MGYVSSNQKWGHTQLIWNAHHLEDSALVLNDGNTKPIVNVMGGVYRAALPTYTAGDAAVAHFTVDGKLMVDTELTLDGNVIIDNIAVWATNIADSTTAGFALIDANGHPQVDVLTLPGGLTGYAEDSQHVSADIGLMGLSVRNDTLAALATTDGDYSPTQLNAKGSQYVDLSSILGTDMSVTNGGFMQITDNTTVAAVTAGLTALKVDLVGEGGAAITATNPVFAELTDGTTAIGTANPLTVQISDGTDVALLSPANTGRAVGDIVMSVQNTGADGTVAPTGSLNTNAPFCQITDGAQNWSIDAGGFGQVDIAAQSLTAVAVSATGAANLVTNPIFTSVSATAAANLVSNPIFVAIGDGTSTADIGIDEASMAATPQFVAIGGEYRAADTTYTDGDAAVLQSDINGYVKVRPKGYDVGTDSQKIFEVSPISQQFVSESLVDTTNLAADTNYYPSATGATMDGYQDISLTGKFIDGDGTVTLTIEAMNDEDTTSGDWIDVTKAWYDAENNTTGNASYTVTNGTLTFALDADNFNYRYYRVVVVNNGATNTVIVKSRRKAL